MIDLSLNLTALRFGLNYSIFRVPRGLKTSSFTFKSALSS